MSHIEPVAAAIYSAMYKDFLEIVYRDRDWEAHRKMMDNMTNDEKKAYDLAVRTGQKEQPTIERRRRPNDNDIEIYAIFITTWGSTALGFGGIGGQAMTSAYTIVIECLGEYAVYFNGRFAYLISRPNRLFFEDIAQRRIAMVRDSSKYKDVDI